MKDKHDPEKNASIKLDGRVNVKFKVEDGRVTQYDGAEDLKGFAGSTGVSLRIRNQSRYDANVLPIRMGGKNLITVKRLTKNEAAVMRFEERRPLSRLEGWLRGDQSGEVISQLQVTRLDGMQPDVIAAGRDEVGRQVFGGQVILRAGSGHSVTVSPGNMAVGEINIHII